MYLIIMIQEAFVAHILSNNWDIESYKRHQWFVFMHINHHNTSFYISLKVIDGGFLAAMYSKTLLVTIRYRYWHIFKYIYRPYISRKIAWLWSTFNIHTTLHICPSSAIVQKPFLCDKKDFLSTWFLLVSIFDI